MSRVARVHIVMGTVELPNRQLQHDETSHDVIDIPAGDDWKLEEVEMVKTGRPPGFSKSMEMAGTEVGQFLSSSSLFGTTFFKYRAVFTEMVDATDVQTTDVPAIEAGDDEITDADVLGEGRSDHE